MSAPFHHLIPVSWNKKLGPMPASYQSADTCPDSCALKDGVCYAEFSHVGLHWRKVNSGQYGEPFAGFLSKVRALPRRILWRYAVAGDLPGHGERINAKQLRALVSANGRRRGFTFSHKPLTAKNRALIEHANANGFTINISADNPAQADRIADLQIGAPLVTVLPVHPGIVPAKNYRTPAGRLIVTCPAVLHKQIQCINCGLCALPARPYLIGFPVHGSGFKKALIIASSAGGSI